MTHHPLAIWVIGPPASGKSTVAEKALVENHGFNLVDVDVPFEIIVEQYGISENITLDTPEVKEKRKKKKDAIDYLVSIGYLDPPLKMHEYENPYDYLLGQEVTTNRATVVAREITKRLKENYIFTKSDIVFVETGGQTGQIINTKKRLEEEGYKTAIVYVCPFHNESFENILNTLNVRSKLRGADGARCLDIDVLERSLKRVIKSKDVLLPAFDKQIFIYSGGLSSRESNQEYLTGEINQWKKEVQ